MVTLGFASVDAQCASPNLIQDASFESGLRPWFAEHYSVGGAQRYYIGYLKNRDAPDGSFVLNVEGWDNTGSSRILSPAIALSGTPCSATIKARCIGENPVMVELAIYGGVKKKLVSFASQTLKPNAQWVTLSGTGVLPGDMSSGQFAVVVTGNSHGTRVELDQVGLFTDIVPGPAINNVETFTWPACALANDKGWCSIEPNFYDRAIAAQELQYVGVPVSAVGEVAAMASIAYPGPHTLWLRCSKGSETLTIELRQGGVSVAVKQVKPDEPASDTEVSHCNSSAGWVLLHADLKAGPVEVVLQYPSGKASTRRFDYLVLSNYKDYIPIPQDFRQGYFRFTNRSPDPYYLFIPRWGSVNHAGLQPGGLGAYGGKDAWIGPSESTPWIRITDTLPKWEAQFSILAAVGRGAYLGKDFYQGRFVGELDFAYGVDHTIVKTFHIDQSKPRFRMTIPCQFKDQPDLFLSAQDHLKKTRLATDSMPARNLPKRIRIMANMNFNTDLDDATLIDGEIDAIKKLGMNAISSPIAPTEQMKSFAESHGLMPMINLWRSSLSCRKGMMKADPDIESMESIAGQSAKDYSDVLDQVSLIKIADEPYGQNWPDMLKSPGAREKFVAYLKGRSLTPKQLGCKSWDEVVLVGPSGKKESPVLYYYSGRYRLQIFNDQITAATALWHKWFPPSALVYVNLEPTYSTTADKIGYDLFGLMRTGGPDMIWSEDWPGYGVSVQQTSDFLTLLTSINRTAKKPLGGYCVAVACVGNGINPILARIKAYTWLANGATLLNFYNYGPQYCNIDAWSYCTNLFPVIASVGADAAVFEGPMEGLKPRPSEVAILYNRTAGIWDNFANVTEADSRYAMWALADRGYSSELVCEDEVEEGILSRYKILYLNGVELQAQTARTIAEWVHNGGTLVGTAGAGTQDEFARPQTTLDAVFGVRSGSLTNLQSAGDVLSTTNAYPYPGLQIKQWRITETLTPLASDTRTILTGNQGNIAGVLHTYGRGKAIRLACLPGDAFVQEAIQGKKFETYLPQEYRTKLARFIAWPAELAGVAPVGKVSSTTPLATLKRWDFGEGATPQRSVVFVIDYSGKPNPDFSVTLPDAAHFTRIRTAHGAKVTVAPGTRGLTQITFPLDVADAIIMEK